MEIWIIVIMGWIIAGTLAYGMNFAYFQRKFPLIAKKDYNKDRLWAIIIGLSGPFGLLGEILRMDGYGLKFK